MRHARAGGAGPHADCDGGRRVTFEGFFWLYFIANLVIAALVVVWMVTIINRLGTISDYLASIDRRLAHGQMPSIEEIKAPSGAPQVERQKVPRSIIGKYEASTLNIDLYNAGLVLRRRTDGAE